MNMKSNLNKLSTVAFAICIGVFTANTTFAQDPITGKTKTPEAGMQQVQPAKQGMTWDEYKADLQSKYQKVMDQVSAIEKQATEKKIDAPEYKEYLNRFQEQAKEFGIYMKNADAVPVEKQGQFKEEMQVQLDRLNKAYEDLKDKWAALNK